MPDSQLSWEVIIVDDASPDGTQDVAKQLATVYGEDKIVCRANNFLGQSYLPLGP
jgi:dolichol-phosphate mannosyltransferase